MRIPCGEKQQRLLATLNSRRHGLRQARRNEASTRRTFGAQIDGLDAGKVLAAEALRQAQAPVAAAPGIDLRFHRRRRGGEYDRDIGPACAHHRHVAGMVARPILLLVSGVVLLIDDDEPEVGEWQKQRRTRADDHAHFAGRDRAPGALAPARRKRRIPFGRAHAEAGGETVEELRGQSDLGQQH